MPTYSFKPFLPFDATAANYPNETLDIAAKRRSAAKTVRRQPELNAWHDMELLPSRSKPLRHIQCRPHSINADLIPERKNVHLEKSS